MAIAVLTSGGDSPGMNACLRSIVRKAIHENIEVYGIYEGFKGMYENKIELFNRKNVSETINRGGTLLRSARFEDFAKKEVAQRAVDNCKSKGIDTLIVIGGNGSYQGGMLVASLGLNVINVPGTIDNDILGTDYTIGLDTAVNTAVDAIDKMRDTSTSHQRASIIEVMGRHNGDIAISAGLACGAEVVITCETGFDREEFISKLTAAENKYKSHSIIILSENMMNIDELGDIVSENTNMKVNKVTLGHIQRGGTPSAYDRIVATKMGHYAVELAKNGEVNRCVVRKCDVITNITFAEYRSLTDEADVRRKQRDNNIIDDVR